MTNQLNVLGQLPRNVKYTIFYGVFGLCFLAYVLIVVTPYLGGAAISVWLMEQIASMTPVILEDVSIPSELVPAVLGGLMAWTAPGHTNNWQTVGLLLLAATVWLLFLHMQVFFGLTWVSDLLTASNTPGDKVIEVVGTLSFFAGSVRSFAAVIFASIVGLRLNDSVGILGVSQEPNGAVPPHQNDSPVLQTPPKEPDDVPDPRAGQAKG